MKKALLVTRASGFIPQHEMNNVKILHEMGYEVHYATNLNDVVYGKDNRRLEGTGIITHQIDFVRSPFSKGVKVAYQQLKELMLSEQFDLVHCHMPMSGVLARLAANKVYKITNRFVPVIYTVHGFHFFKGAPFKNWLYYPVERHMARCTDRLITINQEDYKRAKKFPVRGQAELIKGVGIDLEQFESFRKQSWDIETYESNRKSKEGQSDIVKWNDKGIKVDITTKECEDIRQKYNIPADYTILVSVGELAPGKNNMIAIEALRELRDLKVAYLICGTGRMEQTLQKRVKELGLEKRVFFAGYVENTPAVLQQCDCFIFPSAREGLPVALMEAMAVGLPVVASDVRGINDLIEHTKGGYLVCGFEPEDYAVKVRRMFTEKEGKSAVPRVLRRQQMGEWNMKRVKAFSLSVVDEKMRQIYRSL